MAAVPVIYLFKIGEHGGSRLAVEGHDREVQRGRSLLPLHLPATPFHCIRDRNDVDAGVLAISAISASSSRIRPLQPSLLDYFYRQNRTLTTERIESDVMCGAPRSCSPLMTNVRCKSSWMPHAINQYEEMKGLCRRKRQACLREIPFLSIVVVAISRVAISKNPSLPMNFKAVQAPAIADAEIQKIIDILVLVKNKKK
jgi:hypothetical protein